MSEENDGLSVGSILIILSFIVAAGLMIRWAFTSWVGFIVVSLLTIFIIWAVNHSQPVDEFCNPNQDIYAKCFDCKHPDPSLNCDTRIFH